MTGTQDGGEERPVVTSAAWPVPRKAWRAECERSRGIVDDAPDLDAQGALARNGTYALRWLMLRMIAEYAQHAGHADFLREGIDGAVGA